MKNIKLKVALDQRPKIIKWGLIVASIMPLMFVVVGGIYRLYIAWNHSLGPMWHISSIIGIVIIGLIYWWILHGIYIGIKSMIYLYLIIFNIAFVTQIFKANFVYASLLLFMEVVFLILIFSKPARRWFDFCHKTRKT